MGGNIFFSIGKGMWANIFRITRIKQNVHYVNRKSLIIRNCCMDVPIRICCICCLKCRHIWIMEWPCCMLSAITCSGPMVMGHDAPITWLGHHTHKTDKLNIIHCKWCLVNNNFYLQCKCDFLFYFSQSLCVFACLVCLSVCLFHRIEFNFSFFILNDYVWTWTSYGSVAIGFIYYSLCVLKP